LAGAGSVQIRLQSTVGAFDESFLQKLPVVEEAMITHGLDPGRFIIAKNGSVATMRAFGGTFRDYTVFVDEQHFTVTQPSDMAFLEYFYERCIAPDERVPTPARKLEKVLDRLVNWIGQPV
jgi:hypothetical protein